MIKAVKKFTSVTAVVAIGIGLLSAPVLAEQTGGIGGRPANPITENPRTQSIFIHEVTPGDSVQDEVIVSNGTSEEKKIEIYAVDGVVTNIGDYTCRQKSEVIQDSGKWITFAKNTVTLQPNSTEKVAFSILVPEKANVGEHNACIVFADLNDEGRVSGGVRIQTRQAVRVVTILPGDLHREITLSSFNVTDKKASIAFENKGNVSADVQTSIVGKTLLGQEVQIIRGQNPVLPNSTLSKVYDLDIGTFWGGWYSVEGELLYNAQAGEFGYDSTKESVQRLTAVQYIFVVPSLPALLIYIGILVLLIGFFIGLGLVSARRYKQKKDSIEYIVRDGDTIGSVAAIHGISWKRIAKINKLNAPYTIAVGDKIAIPRGSKREIARKENET